MKTRLKVLPIALCFAVVLSSSIFLTTRAAVDETEHITFSEPTMVGGTLLEADTYKLVWNEPGPRVRVSFLKGSKTVATASATLVLAESNYDGAIEVKTLGDNSKVIVKITWKNKALIFDQSS